MIIKNCLTCKKEFKVYQCRKDTAKYCSKRCHSYGSFGEKGFWFNKKRPEVREWLKVSKEQSIKNLGKYAEEGNPWNKGKNLTFNHRLALSESHKGQIPWNYRGGIKSVYNKIRESFEYKEWRKAVKQRDNYTCVWCGAIENLQADHIKPFAFFPELRFNVNNGRTLCYDCHRKTDTWGVAYI